MRESLRDVLERNEVLATEYSPNNKPEFLDLTSGSNKRVLWVCQEYGCEYEMAINKKVKRPNSCSVCNGSKVFPGYNDLATKFPEIAAEWDYSLNDTAPSEVKFSSSKRFHFICATCGYKYSTVLAQRTSSGYGCRMCGCVAARAKRRAATGDMGVLDMDDDMRRMFVGKGNPSRFRDSKYRFKCDKGHSWRVSPLDFDGCPVCVGKDFQYEGKLLVAPDNPVSAHAGLSELYAASNPIPATHISDASARVVLFVCPSVHQWQAPVYAVKAATQKGSTGCPECTSFVSTPEKELQDWVAALVGEHNLARNTRSVIPPQELDLYLPNYKIAIEFNGLYWHRESKVGKKYHLEKADACAQQGVQLITVWEDDWMLRKPVVKAMLAHKLGLSDQSKVQARKTSLTTISTQEARSFTDHHHIQGFVRGSIYYGLKVGEELVAVSIWRKTRTILYLERYCTSAVVPGGLGKMLKAVRTWAREQKLETIATFSDRTVSDGGLYQALGFTPDKQLRPDYQYLVDGKRVHKFNYRIARFRQDPNLFYQPGLSETQLAALNGLERIWDAGKTRWVLPVE